MPWTGDRNTAIRELAARLESNGARPYAVPYGVSSALGAVGYATAALEIAQQSAALGFTPDAIVHCAGTQLALDQPLLPTPQRSVPLPLTRSRTSYLVPSEPSSARTI